MSLVHTTYVPAGEGPFPTLFALHGWGASSQDLLGLAPLLSEKLFALCPQGSTSVPVGPGQTGYGWFPIVPGQPPKPRAFLKGAIELRAFRDQALQRYPIDERQLFVLGFSQGGLMGYDLVLRDPTRFAGLVVVASWLPAVLAANLPVLAAQQGFPVLVVHGTQDPQVDVAQARESRQILERMGVGLTYEEFEMGHEIRPAALRRISCWMRDVLARSSPSST
jgi:phospholipase/carboxylesterase